PGKRNSAGAVLRPVRRPPNLFFVVAPVTMSSVVVTISALGGDSLVDDLLRVLCRLRRAGARQCCHTGGLHRVAHVEVEELEARRDDELLVQPRCDALEVGVRVLDAGDRGVLSGRITVRAGVLRIAEELEPGERGG